MAIWYILWPFGIFYGRLVICGIWYVFSRFGIVRKEKSGNLGGIEAHNLSLVCAAQHLNQIMLNLQSISNTILQFSIRAQPQSKGLLLFQ
jgi:hypothetical protein